VNLVAWQRINHFRRVVVDVDDPDEHDGDVIGGISGSDVIAPGVDVQRVVGEGFAVQRSPREDDSGPGVDRERTCCDNKQLAFGPRLSFSISNTRSSTIAEGPRDACVS